MFTISDGDEWTWGDFYGYFASNLGATLRTAPLDSEPPVGRKGGVQDEGAFKAGLNNQVTAQGLLKLLRMIAEGRAWSPETCAQMLEILLDQRFKSGIPAGLPGDAHIAHKTGNISTVYHDAGIIYMGNRNPYFLVILTQFPADSRRSGAVAEVSKDLYETLGRLPRPSDLLDAASGPPPVPPGSSPPPG